jgi:hypothetical protein
MRSEDLSFKNLCYWLLKILVLCIITNFLGIIHGIVIGIVLSYIFEFILCKALQLEPFSTGDLCFVGWKKEYEFVLTTVIVLEGKVRDAFKKKLVEEIIPFFEKLRQKPIFLFGNYYWQMFPEAEARSTIHDLDVKGLNSPDEIIAYINANVNNYFSLNEHQYKLYITENENDQTVVVLQCDHSMGDGIAFVSLFCKLTDGFTIDKFPPLRRKHILSKILNYIIFPFYLPFCMIKVFLLRSGPTPFKFKTGPTMNKKVYQCKKLEFMPIYKLTKELGCTFNDFMLAIISKVSKKYSQSLGYKNNSINIICPISLREYPTKMEDMKLNTETCASCIQIPLIDDYMDKTSIKSISSVAEEYLRNHLFAETLNYSTAFVNKFLPIYVSREVILSSSRHFDFVVSNVPGPKDHIYMCGKKVVDKFMFMRPGTHSTFIAVTTYLNKIHLILGHDEDIVCNGKEFLEMIYHEIEASINKTKQN